MIQAYVRGQNLSIVQPTVVSDTINYITIDFTFRDPEWDNLNKWAHFKKDNTIYDVQIVNNKIDKLNLDDGEWEMYLHGNEILNGETVTRITTEIANIHVDKTGPLNGEPLPINPPSVGEQILASADNAVKIAESVRKDADNGKFKGDKGDKGETGYTPKRGVDYWTEEDVSEIQNGLKPELEKKQDKLTFDDTPIEGSQNPVTSSGIKSAINRVEEIAKGRATGYVFDTVEDLDIWLSIPTNVEKLVVGDNLYIKAIDVPDYWWDGVEKQQLETQKVDLSEYDKIVDVNNKLAKKINMSMITNDPVDIDMFLSDCIPTCYAINMFMSMAFVYEASRAVNDINDDAIVDTYQKVADMAKASVQLANYANESMFTEFALGDYDGNNIIETYATKASVENKQDKLTAEQIQNISNVPNKADKTELAKKQDKLTIDTSVTETGGNVVTSKAIYDFVQLAINALKVFIRDEAQAFSAWQDADLNVITATYQKIEDMQYASVSYADCSGTSDYTLCAYGDDLGNTISETYQKIADMADASVFYADTAGSAQNDSNGNDISATYVDNNTFNSVMGDISFALDNILAIQAGYAGGGTA